MEQDPNLESRESIIEQLINNLAEKEGINPDDILSDIITSTQFGDSDPTDPAHEYIKQLAEMVGISEEELKAFAIKKSEEI